MSLRIAIRAAKIGRCLCLFVAILCGVACIGGFVTMRPFPGSFLFLQWGLCFACYCCLLHCGVGFCSAVSDGASVRARKQMRGLASALLGLALIAPVCSFLLVSIVAVSGEAIPLSFSLSFEPSAVASSSAWASALDSRSFSAKMPIEIDLPLIAASSILFLASTGIDDARMNENANHPIKKNTR